MQEVCARLATDSDLQHCGYGHSVSVVVSYLSPLCIHACFNNVHTIVFNKLYAQCIPGCARSTK